jgi:hypothetical protein
MVYPSGWDKNQLFWNIMTFLLICFDIFFSTRFGLAKYLTQKLCFYDDPSVIY